MASRKGPPLGSTPEFGATPLQARHWARLLTEAERQALLGTIRDEMRWRGVMAQLFDGYLQGLLPDGSTVQCGFYNLAVRCGAAEIGAYPALVRAHFDRVLPPTSRAPGQPFVAFDEVAPSVWAHVYDERALEGLGPHVIKRRLAEGFWAVPVVSFESAQATIEPAVAAAWGRSEDELLRLGVENVGRLKTTREALPIADGARHGFVLRTGEPAAASQLLRLGHHLGGPHPAGALVAVPSRHLLMGLPLHPADGPHALGALRSLIDLTRRTYRRVAERDLAPFSDEVFWWHEGRLERLHAGEGAGGASGDDESAPGDETSGVAGDAGGAAGDETSAVAGDAGGVAGADEPGARLLRLLATREGDVE
ncbi:MAG TPA: hypothetical protein VFS00_23950 [Polyangiaceae bacterium]|nr:hypothetical protein [Polyangiaceae bacterium]